MTKLRVLASILGFTAGLALVMPASAADMKGITLSTDEVRVITFGSAVKTVFVGNPTIADVTIIDSTHAFVLGKAFGTTNLVTLDDSGRQTADERIVVLNHQESIVTLQRGAARSTLYCAAGRCEVSPTPGDEAERFDAVAGQIDRREAQNLKSAGGGGQ